MRLKFFLFLCLAFPLLTGWGHWGPPVKVGLSLDNLQGKESLVTNMKDEMEESRGELLVQDAKGNSATQLDQVRQLIQKGIQALVVVPCDPAKAAPLIDAAHQAGIKVISLESLIPGSDLDYLVGFNQEKAGELQAKAMVKKVPKGHYVLLEEGSSGRFSRNLREGQMKVLQPLIDKGDIQIVASESAHPTGKTKGIKAILAREKNKVDAVLASDSQTAEEVVQALEKENLSIKVPVAGQGQDLATCRRILSETQTMTIYHPPKKLAEEAAYLAAKLARKATQFDCQFVEMDNSGKKTQAVFLTPLVVDAKNLNSTVISDGVQKKEDVYGK